MFIKIYKLIVCTIQKSFNKFIQQGHIKIKSNKRHSLNFLLIKKSWFIKKKKLAQIPQKY